MISLAIGAFRTTLNKLELSVSEWKQDRIRVFSEINETRIYDNDINSNDDNYNTGNDVNHDNENSGDDYNNEDYDEGNDANNDRNNDYNGNNDSNEEM